MAKRGRKPIKEMIEKRIQIDWSTYDSIRSPNSKYTRGEKIETLDDLLRQRVVILNFKAVNYAWVLSQQIRWVMRFLQEGCFYYAIPKNKEKKKEENKE